MSTVVDTNNINNAPVEPPVETDPTLTQTPTDTPKEADEDKEWSSWLETVGSREIVKKGTEIYQTYINPEGFDADKFWTEMADASAARYNAAAVNMFQKHPDHAVKIGLGLKSLDEVAKVREFVKGGMKAPAVSKEDRMGDEELEAIDEPWAKELLETRRWRRERDEADRQRAEAQAQYEAEATRKEVGEKYNSLISSHEGEIDKDIKALNLGDDELGRKAQKAIKALALANFYEDQTSSKILRTATQHIQEREYQLGFQLLPTIIKRQRESTKEAAQFISDLLQSKRAEGALKRDAAQKVINPPAGGAVAPPAASNPSSGSGPFDPKDQLARYRELKAQGR